MAKELSGIGGNTLGVTPDPKIRINEQGQPCREIVQPDGTKKLVPINSKFENPIIAGSSNSSEDTFIRSGSAKKTIHEYLGYQVNEELISRSNYGKYILMEHDSQDIDSAEMALKSKLGTEKYAECSAREKSIMIGLVLAYKRGDVNEATLAQLVSDFGTDEAKAKADAYLKEHSGEVDETKLKHLRYICEKSAALENVVIFTAAEQAPTTQKKEKLISAHADKIEKSQKKMIEKIGEALPEGISKEDAKKILSTTSTYTTTKVENLKKHLAEKSNGYSKAFVDKITKVINKAQRNLLTIISQGIEAFFKTPKGRAIKRAIEHVKHEKEEFMKQCKKVKDIKQALRKEQEKQEVARENAERAMKKAMSALEERKIKCNASLLPQILKKVSPNLANLYTEAMHRMKIANNVVYERESEYRLNCAFAKIDKDSYVAARENLHAQVYATIAFG